jgi:ATP-binding cassette subfamily C protein
MLINVDRLVKPEGRSIFASVIDPFAIVPIRHRVFVVTGLLLSSLLEMIGLGAVIPLLSTVSFGTSPVAPPVGMARSVINDGFHAALESIGLSANITTLILMVVVGLSIKSTVTITVMRHVGDLMADITTAVRLAVTRALLQANWQYFSAQPLGRLVSATGAESGAIGESFFCAANVIATFLQVMAYCIISILISWKLALVALFICAIMLFTFGQLVKMSKTASRQHKRQMREMASSFTDTILGMKPIKAMGRQARFAALFEADAKKLHATLRTKVLSSEFAAEFQEPMIAALLCFGLFFATTSWHLKLHEQLVMGLLLIRLIGSFTNGQRVYQRLISLQGMYRALGELLYATTQAEEAYPGRVPPTFKNGVTFKNVSFGYISEDQVLTNVDWQLPVGRISALIGPSGAGKTTVVDLIMGLRQPKLGEVIVDGIDMKDLDITAWRHMIGYVPQEVVLFNDTIYNNVTLGEPDFSEAEVIEALNAAGASNFVSSLPEGIDESVGERGHRLSGGQRQRIAIARALLRRPALLILDEATTGLDREVEAEICSAIQKLVEDRQIAVLAISHQRTWTSIADQIYVLEDRGINLQAAVSETEKLSTVAQNA